MVPILKKQYKSQNKKQEMNVLETLLFAVCLENNSYEDAQAAYDRLDSDFFDLNEVRVSSITELQNVFRDQSQPEWRAMRIREILQHTFESGYSFDLETLRKKTLDSAEKQLNKIRSLSPFVKSYVFSQALGNHTIPMDDLMTKASIWLGIITENTEPSHAGEQLKSSIRKAESQAFSYLFRALATDQKYHPIFEQELEPTLNGDPIGRLNGAPNRLTQLFKGAFKVKKKSTTKTKAASKKKAATKKKAVKKKAAKPAKKTTTKKAATKKKAAAKKSTKKTAAKKKTKKSKR